MDEQETEALRLTAERYGEPLDTPWLDRTLFYALTLLSLRLRVLGREILRPIRRLLG